MYRADSVYLDVIDLAHRHALLDTHGAITFGTCADMTVMMPVTFTTEGSVVELTPWRPMTSGSRSLQFQLTTNEPNALVMYSLGAVGTTDFFAVEIVEGE
jgi:hypothetical protein